MSSQMHSGTLRTSLRFRQYGEGLSGVGKESARRGGWLPTTCVASRYLRASGADRLQQARSLTLQAFYRDPASMGLSHGQRTKLVRGIPEGYRQKAVGQDPRMVHNRQDLSSRGLRWVDIISEHCPTSSVDRGRWAHLQ